MKECGLAATVGGRQRSCRWSSQRESAMRGDPVQGCKRHALQQLKGRATEHSAAATLISDRFKYLNWCNTHFLMLVCLIAM